MTVEEGVNDPLPPAEDVERDNDGGGGEPEEGDR
jgi:hypothetical protein